MDYERRIEVTFENRVKVIVTSTMIHTEHNDKVVASFRLEDGTFWLLDSTRIRQLLSRLGYTCTSDLLVECKIQYVPGRTKYYFGRLGDIPNLSHKQVPGPF